MSSNPYESPLTFLDSLVNKSVSIELMDGRTISGGLMSRDPKDNSILLRRLADEEPVLITWQAVKMIYRMPDEFGEAGNRWLPPSGTES